MSQIRVLLVDDHALMRAGLCALLELEPDITVVGEAGSGEEGIARAAELKPDLVLMDLSMPGMDGLEATREVMALGQEIRVLILTMHAEQEYLLPVLDAGASGYVTKNSADGELLEAIRTVARGQVFLYPSGTRMLLKSFRGGGDGHAEDPLQKLSSREREVLSRTAEGFTSSEIGEQLQISPKTVDTYRQRLMEKLGMHHRSELVHFALRRGLLTTAR
jgi:two-component system response regulator NreC